MDPIILLKTFLEQYYVSIAVFVVFITLVSEPLIILLKTSDKTFLNLISMNQLLTWVVSIVLSLVGSYFQLGMFLGLDFLWTVVYGIVIGGFANAFYDMSVVEWIINKFGELFKKK